MDSLPTELISQVIEDLPCADLRRLRATNKRINSIVLPFAFQEVVITDTLQSVQGLRSLLLHSNICETITTIRFRENGVAGTSDVYHAGLCSLSSSVYLYSLTYTIDPHEFFDSIRDAFSCLCFARGLKRISIELNVNDSARFSPYLDTYAPRSTVGVKLQPRLQLAIIAGLARAVTSDSLLTLQHLSLTGLIPWRCKEWPLLHRLFQPLVTLTVEVVCNYLGRHSGDNIGADEFFAQIVKPRIFKRCTSLRGLWFRVTMPRQPPLFSMRAVSFPQLTRLILDNIVFNLSDLDGFVVQYGKILIALKLKSCWLCIVHHRSTQWWQIWKRFTKALTALTCLQVGTMRYCAESSRGRSKIVDVPVTLQQKDARALEALKSVVSARTTGLMGKE